MVRRPHCVVLLVGRGAEKAPQGSRGVDVGQIGLKSNASRQGKPKQLYERSKCHETGENKEVA